MKIEPAQTRQYHCPETETLCSKCESHCEAAQPVQPAVAVNEQLLEALKFAHVLLKDQCMDTALVKLKIETAICAAAKKGGV